MQKFSRNFHHRFGTIVIQSYLYSYQAKTTTMKQSLFIILCLALLASCQSEDSKEEQANKMPTEIRC